jgi:putative tryptophan/tyrosine transport system substrate-binding protein
MAIHIRRREFIFTLGGAATAWPLTARAQKPAMPVIGFLSARSPPESASVLGAFRQGLGEAGYFEGKNVTIEYRWAEGQYDRLPALAAELVQRQVTVIAATGGEPSAQAAKAATSTIPIVASLGGDPVEAGLVASLSRPGGNLTGATIMGQQLGPKRLELLRQLVPNATAIAMLTNPNFPAASAEARDVRNAAVNLGIQANVLNATTENEIDTAFLALFQQKADALVIATDAFLLGQRDQLIRLAAHYKVPTIYFLRDFVEAGGLMSYGPNLANSYRQVGVYTGQILSGANPATLPVLQPTHFVFFLNLKTAKVLGLAIPDKLLALADEVIE